MKITESIYQDIKLKSNKLFVVVVLTLVFLTGLGIGFLVKKGESSQIIIDKNAKIGLPAQAGLPAFTAQASGNFMASINGTAYYPKGCPSANRINEENIIWFSTKEEAEMQGYKPAQNCGF
ncbi:MAG: Ada metal-binding domain-containing protein [Patescibacteria group bacterium]